MPRREIGLPVWSPHRHIPKLSHRLDTKLPTKEFFRENDIHDENCVRCGKTFRTGPIMNMNTGRFVENPNRSTCADCLMSKVII